MRALSPPASLTAAPGIIVLDANLAVVSMSEPTPAAQISSILLSAHGLTEAQARVAALVLRGQSTQQIVRELHISASTVRST